MVEDLELSVSLFDNCNLNCSFCFSQFTNKIDKAEILNIPQKMEERIKYELEKNNTKKNLVVRTWGGELFYDSLPDDLFDVYVEYLNKVKSIINKYSSNINKLTFTWVSNAVWTKVERVEKLLKNTNTKLAVSYDAIGRFKSDEQKDLWLNNVKHFKDYIYTVGITLTHQNMELLPTDEWFNEVIKLDLPVDASLYWPNKNWEHYLPTEDDLFEFFKWCAENCPHLINLYGMCKASLFEPVNLACMCNNTITYVRKFCTKDCVRYTAPTLDPVLFYGSDNESTLQSDENCFDIKIKRFQNIKNCICCKYYKNCPGLCPGTLIFKHFKHSKVCCLFRMYEYLSQHPDIRQRILNTFIGETNESN